MSLLSKLFGGSKSTAAKTESETYKGFTLTPTLISEGSRFRLSARIDKEVDGEPLSHTLIRADVIDSRDEATEASLSKAKQMIDEQGERLFR